MVHRSFYPTLKPGQQPGDSSPIAKASSVISAAGVKITFLEPSRNFTPRELRHLANWLHALSNEATDLSLEGHIAPGQSYDVSRNKVVRPEADTTT